MILRLYFETSELVATGWPRISADLENVLKITASVGIPVFFPAGVEIELEQRWRRGLEEKITELGSKVQAVEAYVGGVQKMKISVDAPDPVKAFADYRGAVDALKQKYGLSTVPFTGRSVTEIFKMAVERHPPFKETKEDVGFRDAVIFLSVVDDLSTATGKSGALVSHDSAFHDPKIIEFAARAGVTLQVFHSVENVFSSLMEEAAAYVTEKWQEKAAQAQRSLNSRLPAITKFITETLEVPEWALVPGWRVVAVSRIEALAVQGVRVPNPLEMEKLERIRLSFDVQVKLHATIERLEMPQVRRVKVGPETPSLLGALASLGASGSTAQSLFAATQTNEVEVDRLVRVDANSDPTFEALAFESASLVIEGLGGMRVGL